MATDKSIKGIGNDIVEIARIRKSIQRHGLHFLNRVFTQREQDYCYKFQDPIPHFAGRFCAKEAIVKALGTGLSSSTQWLDFEILQDERGKPIVFFSEELQRKFGSPQLLVSISHSIEYAIAVAIWI